MEHNGTKMKKYFIIILPCLLSNGDIPIAGWFMMETPITNG
jgi:hypothetical protein